MMKHGLAFPCYVVTKLFLSYIMEFFHMYNKKRKAIFFDIDGTLLIPGEGIHESVREALKKVRNHGHQIFIATGRAWCCLPEELQDVELDGLIASAGSDIWFHGQNVYRQSLSPELIEHTCQILKEMDAVYLLEGFGPDLCVREGTADSPWERGAAE